MKKYYLITRTLFILTLCGYALSGRGQTQLGGNISGAANKDEAGRVSISADGKIVAIGAPFHDETGKENAGHVRIFEYKTNTSGSSTASGGTGGWTQLLGGGELNGEAAGDQSGYSVSLSADGKTVAIGAPYNDAGGSNAGHVRVYKYNGITWTQLGGDLNGAAADDQSGHSVSLSADGTTVAIGAPYHDETGKSNAGHVRVYKYNGTVWTQLGGDINGTASRDESGYSVSLSDDGKIVAIGAPKHNGDGPLHTKDDVGQVLIYKYNAPTGTATIGTWTPLGGEIEGKAVNDWLGWSVSLSADGKTVAIGATRQPAGGDAPSYVRVYDYNASRTGKKWKQVGTDINQAEAGTTEENKLNKFGWSVSLSGDGKTVAIGEPEKGGNPSTHPRMGRTRIYKRDAGTTAGWKQLGAEINGEVANGELGTSVSLSADGTTVAVGSKGVNYTFGTGTPGHVQVYEFFLITSPSTATVAENATTAAYTITSNKASASFTLGTAKDESLFNLNGSELSFKTPPDFENPAGKNKNAATDAAKNVYEVQITATAGTGSSAQTTTQDVTITVTNVVEPPVFSSAATKEVLENTLTTTAVYTAAVSDASTKDAVTFSLETPAAANTADDDNAKFTIDGTTGAVKFVAVPDHEAPVDANTDNVYNIQITATVPLSAAQAGGTAQAVTHDVTITVINILDENPPSITSAATKEVPENTTGTVYTATATDDATAAAAITFSLAAGVKDNDLFEITSAGAVSFKTAPDFENPVDTYTDASATPAVEAKDNQYEIQITARDEVGNNSAPKAVTITVTNVVEAPVFTSAAAKEVAENTTASGGTGTATGYTAAATADFTVTTGVSFSLVSGVKDNDLFEITSAGLLTFKIAPDYESPAGKNKNAATAAEQNVYELQITATATTGTSTTGTSGTRTSTHDLTITVTNVVEVPVFTSEATAQTLENGTASGGTGTGTVYRAVATPSVSTSTVTFSLKAPDANAGNADDDNDKFTIDGTTGAVKFKVAPDYENPADEGGNNVYNIQITATAGGESVTKDVAITVNNMVEPPVFTSEATKEVPENITGTVYTATTATDTDAPTFTLRAPSANAAVTVDDDNDKFTITSGGSVPPRAAAVKFRASPDFENPADANKDNVYNIQITATAGGDNVIHNVAITVTAVDNTAPTITSAATTTVPENDQSFAYTITANEAATFALGTAGGDEALFKLTANKVSFKLHTAFSGTGPDFENPKDSNKDNVYKVELKATDAGGNVNAGTFILSIRVTDVDDTPPVITSAATAKAKENTTDFAYTITATDNASAAADITFSLGTAGGDEALFKLTANKVSFIATPDYEMPKDADNNNVYKLELKARDAAGNEGKKILSITVTDVDEIAPVITASNASMAENTKDFAHKATANEAVTFSLVSAIKDNQWFTLKKVSSKETAISFKTPPVFANPQDANKDNIYELELKATDAAGNRGKKNLSITVTDVDDTAPTITSSATATVAENTTDFVYMITAMDDASATVAITFSLGTAGGDEALFKLTANKVSFRVLTAFSGTGPDFEVPKDADKDNVYKLELKATDAAGNEGKKVLSITVTDVVEPGIISLPETLTFADTKVGETASKVLTIKNTGNDAVLKVTAITYPTGFTGNWPSGTIAAGGEQVVKVSFKPTEAKAYTGTITVTSDAANAADGKNTLSVSGKGVLITALTAKGGTSEQGAAFPGLSVFPNPAGDLLNIKLPNQNGSFSLQLTDVNGQVVYEQEAVTSDELSIDVSGYKSGVYVLVLSSGSKVEKQKVVIK